METKSILNSKTFWFNLVAGLVAISAYVDPELLTAMGFSADVQPKVLKLVGAAVAAGNVLLRFLTGQPVAMPNVKKGVNIFLVAAGLFFVAGAGGCKAYNQLVNHCSISGELYAGEGGFKTCLQCDSLATAIKNIALKK